MDAQKASKIFALMMTIIFGLLMAFVFIFWPMNAVAGGPTGAQWWGVTGDSMYAKKTIIWGIDRLVVDTVEVGDDLINDFSAAASGLTVLSGALGIASGAVTENMMDINNAPGAGTDGWSLTWNNGAGKPEWANISSGTPSNCDIPVIESGTQREDSLIALWFGDGFDVTLDNDSSKVTLDLAEIIFDYMALDSIRVGTDTITNFTAGASGLSVIDGALGIASNGVVENMIDVANAPVDEYVLTYETDDTKLKYEPRLQFFTETQDNDTAFLEASSPGDKIGFKDSVFFHDDIVMVTAKTIDGVDVSAIPSTYLRVAGDTVTGGDFDFGAAGAFEIPNSGGPTVDLPGEIAIDTDADGNYIDQGWITYYDGSQQMYVPAFDAIGTPSDNDVLAYDAGLDKWLIQAQTGGSGTIDSAIIDEGAGSYKSSSAKAWKMRAGANISFTTLTDSSGVDTFTISASGAGTSDSLTIYSGTADYSILNNFVRVSFPYGFAIGEGDSSSVDTLNIRVDTADAVTNGEAKVVTGNAVYDYIATWWNIDTSFSVLSRAYFDTSIISDSIVPFGLYNGTIEVLCSGDTVFFIDGNDSLKFTNDGTDWIIDGGDSYLKADSAIFDTIAYFVSPGETDTAFITNIFLDSIRGNEFGGSGSYLGDLLTTSPLRIDGGANVNDILGGSDADYTLTITDADADGSTKGAATFNADDFDAASGVISIDNTNFTMDDLSDGATNAAITLTQETNFETAYTHSGNNTQAHTDYMRNVGDTVTGHYLFNGDSMAVGATDAHAIFKVIEFDSSAMAMRALHTSKASCDLIFDCQDADFGGRDYAHIKHSALGTKKGYLDFILSDSLFNDSTWFGWKMGQGTGQAQAYEMMLWKDSLTLETDALFRGYLEVGGAMTAGSTYTTSIMDIPSGATPSVSAEGELALDNNADGTYITQGWLTYHDGTQQMYVPGFDAIGTPSDNDVIAYDAGADKWLIQAQTGGAGEANTISDSGIYNETSGFGLAAGKSGTILNVKGLIEGSNITITKNDDSALVIASSGGSGLWTDDGNATGHDSTMLADADDNDSLMIISDDDGGHVTWTIGADQTSLKIPADTIGVAGLTTTDSLDAVRVKMDTLDLGGDLVIDLAGVGLTIDAQDSLEVDTTVIATIGALNDSLAVIRDTINVIFPDSGSYKEMPKIVITEKGYIGNVSDTTETDSLIATHGYVSLMGSSGTADTLNIANKGATDSLKNPGARISLRAGQGLEFTFSNDSAFISIDSSELLSEGEEFDTNYVFITVDSSQLDTITTNKIKIASQFILGSDSIQDITGYGLSNDDDSLNVDTSLIATVGDLADYYRLDADVFDSNVTGDVTLSSGVSSIGIDKVDATHIGTGEVGDDEIDYANVTLADFDYQTAWTVFYANTDGDVTELALGADEYFLMSNGAAAAPTFEAIPIRDTFEVITDTVCFSITIDNPDNLASDTVMILPVEAEWAPTGITLLSVGLKTWAATSYSVTFMEFTQPGDGGTESTIEAVATSTSREAEDDGTLSDAAIAAGSIIVVILDTDDIDQVTFWGTYYVNK